MPNPPTAVGSSSSYSLGEQSRTEPGNGAWDGEDGAWDGEDGAWDGEDGAADGEDGAVPGAAAPAARRPERRPPVAPSPAPPPQQRSGPRLDILRNLTRRSRLIDALRHERAFTHAVLREGDALIVLLDHNGRIVRFSRTCEEITGYTFDEVKGMCIWDLLAPPEDVGPMRESFRRLQAAQFPERHENCLIARDGTRRWISWSTAALTDNADRLSYIVAVGIDITEQRKAERRLKSTLLTLWRLHERISVLIESLRASEQRTQSIANTARDAVVTTDAAGRIISWNEAAEAMFAYDADTIIGQPLAAIVPGRLRRTEQGGVLAPATVWGSHAWVPHVWDTPQGGGRTFAMTGMRRDGSPFPLELTLTSWQVKHATFFTMMMRDVTRRKEVQAHLETAGRALQTMVRTSPLAIVAVDVDGTVRQWNPAATGLLGWSADEVVGRPVPFVPPEHQDAYASLVAGLRHGEGVVSQATRRRRRDGSRIDVKLWAVALRDPGGRVSGHICIMADTTERRLAEEQVQRYAAEQRLLLDVAAAVSGTPDLDELLVAVLDTVLPALQADAGWVIIAGGGVGEATRVVARRGRAKLVETAGPADFQATCPLFAGRLGTAAGPREIETNCPNWAEEVWSNGNFRHHVCVPLSAAGKVLGVLKLGWLSPEPAAEAPLQPVGEVGSQPMDEVALQPADEAILQPADNVPPQPETRTPDQPEVDAAELPVSPAAEWTDQPAGGPGLAEAASGQVSGHDPDEDLHPVPDAVPVAPLPDLNPELLTALGQQVGLALYNARLTEAAHPAARPLAPSAAPSALPSAMLTHLDLEQTLADTLALAADFDAPLGVLLVGRPWATAERSEARFTPGWAALQAASGAGAPDVAAWWRAAADRISPEAVCLDLSGDELAEYGGTNAEAEAWGPHGIALPLWGDDDLAGVLFLGGRPLNRPFTEEERVRLHQTASEAGRAIQHVQRYEAFVHSLQETEQMRRSAVRDEKLLALDRFVAQITHEISDPLQAVCSALGLFQEEWRGRRRTDRLEDCLALAHGEMGRIHYLVRRLDDFGPPVVRDVEVVDLPALVQGVLDLVDGQLRRHNVVAKVVLGQDVPTIEGHPDHLKQVFLSLVLNAIEAMPDRGKLEIRLAPEPLPTGPSEPARPAVRVEISDTGIGMAPAVQSRIFEPFYTTKEQHAGFALYVSYGIIRAHGGRISFSSEEAVGTTFTVHLPVNQAPRA